MKKVKCNENYSHSAINKQMRDIGKVDPPSLMDKQILTEGRIENCAITSLLNEKIEIILVNAVKSSEKSIEKYVILSPACWRFNGMLKRKKDNVFSHIHMKFTDSVFYSLPHFRNKMKENIQKIMKMFGPSCGVVTSLVEIVQDKKWRSAWLVINHEK